MATRVAEELRKIPWITLVAVTGSVATEWPKKNDDIDFLIVCENKRLWLCRFMVVWKLILEGFKLRNFSNKKRNRLCFNLWLEEDSMEIDKKRQNILTALDIIWMKVLFERDKIFNKS